RPPEIHSCKGATLRCNIKTRTTSSLRRKTPGSSKPASTPTLDLQASPDRGSYGGKPAGTAALGPGWCPKMGAAVCNQTWSLPKAVL
ncbi:Hypothetical predicted protein, partial [Marmota monax]